MTTHSSVPAWRIPGMAEPGALPSTGSHRVGHDWSDLAAAVAARQTKKDPARLIVKINVRFFWSLFHAVWWAIPMRKKKNKKQKQVRWQIYLKSTLLKMNAIHSWCLRTLNVAFQMNASVFTLGHLLSLVIFRRSVNGRTKPSPTETLQTKQLAYDVRYSLANSWRLD